MSQMDSKQCSKCKQTKPLTYFGYRTDGWYNSWCRPCVNANMRKRNRDGNFLERSKDQKLVMERKRRERAGLAVAKHLCTHPCVDCGETELAVLDFDHRDPATKSYSVTRMVSLQFGLESIFKEIGKCDVRCANCHRRRTAKMQNWRRLSYTCEAD